jgi:hypothetical protein
MPPLTVHPITVAVPVASSMIINTDPGTSRHDNNRAGGDVRTAVAIGTAVKSGAASLSRVSCRIDCG